MKKYKIHDPHYYMKPVKDIDEIVEFEVMRETRNFYILESGKMVAKSTKDYICFDSWEEAQAILIKRISERISRNSHVIGDCKSRLQKILGMNPPNLITREGQ